MRIIFDKEEYIEPLTYMYEEDDKIVITADLPCVNKDDVEVNAGENTIEINALIKGYKKAKFSVKFFHKVITLPVKIRDVKAKFENGRLIITIPKQKDKMRIKIE